MADFEKLAGKQINLVASENKMRLTPIESVFFGILFVLIIVFAKFGVFDPLANAARGSEEVFEAQARLNELLKENAEYEDIAALYSRYIIQGLSEDERNTVDRTEVTDLLRKKVMRVGSLSSVAIKGNVVTASLSINDLEAVSALVNSLESDNRVSSVTVTTAQSKENVRATATIEITMKNPADASSENDSKKGIPTSGSSTKGVNDGE